MINSASTNSRENRHSMLSEDLRNLHRSLGIPDDYPGISGMPVCPECDSLVAAGNDLFGRPSQMQAATLQAWNAMQKTARQEQVELQLVSAFRSVEYQAGLIRRKLENGLDITRILQVNAAPGFSEHHTGRALDLNCPGCEPLSESFEKTDAFQWLCSHGKQFGFVLSFPRNNPFGVVYEPWHWCYRK